MRRIRLALKYLFAAFFVLGGVNHFVNPAFYLKIMPPYLPWHLPLVYVSGVVEIALGLLLLTKKFTRAAAWGIVALLVAVSPVNVHMAINHGLYPGYGVAALWLRLPLQLALIVWAYWYTLPVVGGRDGGDDLTA
ncbi:MAG: DoxX family membrane protein [Acidobacteria bacterium]|nr:DoxX family membrane protein [Acidobacteriota bacterium]MCA1642759.1 DoxX family membrane protein [Acidobacteriota bacterium]